MFYFIILLLNLIFILSVFHLAIFFTPHSEPEKDKVAVLIVQIPVPSPSSSQPDTTSTPDHVPPPSSNTTDPTCTQLVIYQSPSLYSFELQILYHLLQQHDSSISTKSVSTQTDEGLPSTKSVSTQTDEGLPSTDPVRILPNELKHRIFLNLDFKDWVRCKGVSKSWLEYLNDDHLLWTSASLTFNDQEHTYLKRHLDSIPNPSRVFLINAISIFNLRAIDETLRLFTKGEFKLQKINRLRIDYYNKDYSNGYHYEQEDADEEDEDDNDYDSDDDSDDDGIIIDRGEDFLGESSPSLRNDTNRLRDDSATPNELNNTGTALAISPMYNLAPVTELQIGDVYEFIHLDSLLRSQSNSLEKLVIFSESVIIQQPHVNQTFDVLKVLMLYLQNVDHTVISFIHNCTKLALLDLEVVESSTIPINTFLNNITSTLLSLRLSGFIFSVDRTSEVTAYWPTQLRSLVLDSYGVLSSSSSHHWYRHVHGDLKGLARLALRYEPAALELFNLYQCGENLVDIDFTGSPADQINPAMFPNVKHAYFSDCSLGELFLSNCHELKQLKIIDLNLIKSTKGYLLAVATKLAQLELEHIRMNVVDIPQYKIEEIVKLGVKVYDIYYPQRMFDGIQKYE